MKNKFLFAFLLSISYSVSGQEFPVDWCEDYKNEREVYTLSQINEDNFITNDVEVSPRMTRYYENTYDECRSSSKLVEKYIGWLIEINGEKCMLSLVDDVLLIRKIDDDGKIKEQNKIKLPLDKKAGVRDRSMFSTEQSINILISGTISGKSEFVHLFVISKSNLSEIETQESYILEGDIVSCEIHTVWFDIEKNRTGVAYSVNENNAQSVYVGFIEEHVWKSEIVHKFEKKDAVQNIIQVGNPEKSANFIQVLYSNNDKEKPIGVVNIDFEGNELGMYEFSYESLTEGVLLKEKNEILSNINKGLLPPRWNAGGNNYKEYKEIVVASDNGFAIAHSSARPSILTSKLENDFFVTFSDLSGKIIAAKMIDYISSVIEGSNYNLFIHKDRLFLVFNDDAGWYNNEGVFNKSESSKRLHKSRPAFYSLDLKTGVDYRGGIPSTFMHDRLGPSFEFNGERLIFIYSDADKMTRLGVIK